jgi:hypothetical protein
MGANRFAACLAVTFLLAVLFTVPRFLGATEPPANQQPSAEVSKPAGNTLAAPPSATIVESSEARGILGRAVKDSTEVNMGHIVDVVVDPSGQVLAAVIDFGGFLGVGSRKIAVEWTALQFRRAVKDGDDVRLELTRDQLKAAPEYKDGKPLVVIGAVGDLRSLDTPAPNKPEK